MKIFVLLAVFSLQDVRSLIIQNDLKKAEEVALSLEKSSQREGYLGYIYEKQRKYSKSITHYLDGIRINDGSDTLYFHLHKNIAEILRRTKQYKIASSFNNKQFELLEHFPDGEFKRNEEVAYYFNRGLLYMDMGDISEATFNFAKSLDISVSPNQRDRALNQLGRVHFESRSFQLAIEYYDKIINSGNKNKYLGKAYHNKAECMKELGLDPVPHYLNALQVKKGISRQITLMDLGEYTQDESLLLESASLLRENSDPDEYKIYDILRKYYESTGQFEKSSGYTDRYILASLAFIEQNEKVRAKTVEHQAAFAIKNYNKIKDLTYNISILNWIIPLLFVLILFSIWIVVRMRRKRKELSKEADKVIS